MTDRLAQQLDFLREAEKLKSVYRATALPDQSRRENSAEHSWSVALYALILQDQAGEGVDIARAITMLLLHDLVEIDVGDVPIHAQGGSAHSSAAVKEAEERAAARLFGLLPEGQAEQMLAIWLEFEGGVTPTALYARALDRVQPVLLNHAGGGGSWREYDVSFDQLEERVGVKVARGLPALWQAVREHVKPWFVSHGKA